MPLTADAALLLIRDLLATRKYEWCRETLEGISETIASTGRCSLRQQEAIEHIMLGRLKHDVGPA
jgi:hypothetical protein